MLAKTKTAVTDENEPNTMPRRIPPAAEMPFAARNVCALVLRIPADMRSVERDSRLCLAFSLSIARASHVTNGLSTRSWNRARSGPDETRTLPYVAAERVRARRLRAGSVATLPTQSAESVRQIAARMSSMGIGINL